jgi:hypothetical protein
VQPSDTGDTHGQGPAGDQPAPDHRADGAGATPDPPAPQRRGRLRFALPTAAPRLLTRGKTVPPWRAILETAGLLVAYELATGFLVLPVLVELVAASLVFLWGLRRLDRITVPRLSVLYGLAGAGEMLGGEVIDPMIHRLLGYPAHFIDFAGSFSFGHRSIVSAGVFVLLPVLVLAYFNPGIREELKALVRVEGRGLDPLRSLAAAAVVVVFALSLLRTDLSLDSVGYVHRYPPTAAGQAAASAAEPVATTPDPVTTCADELQSLLAQAETAADYDGDGRVDNQAVIQELAQLIGAQDPRFQVLVSAYASFLGSRFQNGAAAAHQSYREELERHCRSEGGQSYSDAPETSLPEVETGCRGSSDPDCEGVPDVEEASGTAASPSTGSPLDGVDLARAVRLDCSQAGGPAQVDEQAFGDVNDDGIDDAVVAAACTASTSSWPDRVEVFDGASPDPAHPRRLATLLDDGDGTDERGVRVQGIRIRGTTVTVTSTGYLAADPNAAPSQRVVDTFTWDGDGFGPRRRAVTNLGG